MVLSIRPKNKLAVRFCSSAALSMKRSNGRSKCPTMDMAVSKCARCGNDQTRPTDMPPNAIECTLILKRVYDAPIDRVWKAWTDPEELGKWYVAGTDHVVHFCEADVRIGGLYRVGFAPPGQTP